MRNESGRAVLVTGCSSGIGLAAAKALHQRGYLVFATARDDQSIEMLNHIGVTPVFMDGRNSASIRDAVDMVAGTTNGKLYGVFHNIGYGQSGALEDLPRDALREQFETNVFGLHELNSLIIPMMRRQTYGRLIINSSVLGYVAQKYKGAYVASKYALEAIADTLRLELHGSGIHVSLIEPGPIESRFRQHSLAAFKRFVDIGNSVHAAAYRGFVEKLATEGPITRWTLPASACLPPLFDALESRKPKARYQVTFPSKLLFVLKRLMTARQLDRLLMNGL